MNTRSRLNARAATLSVVAAFSALAPCLTLPAHSASKKQQPQLEIWPGRRVLLVLPITLSADWNADTSLGNAMIPLAQPQLQKAFTATGKFSTTLPYRFDPVLRRGLVEKQISQDDIDALVKSATLDTAKPVVSKLSFDQPVMVAEVTLDELRIGGTALIPTVQIKATGHLYQQGAPDLAIVKSIVVTSHSETGKTPTERLTAAAADAFNDIAAGFAAPPPAFDLPMPVETAPAAGTAAAPAAGTSPAAPAAPAPMNPVATPNSLPIVPGTPFVPAIQAGQPPMGVGAGANLPAGN
jgi:hypothetical protein